MRATKIDVGSKKSVVSKKELKTDLHHNLSIWWPSRFAGKAFHLKFCFAVSKNEELLLSVSCRAR